MLNPQCHRQSKKEFISLPQNFPYQIAGAKQVEQEKKKQN